MRIYVLGVAFFWSFSNVLLSNLEKHLKNSKKMLLREHIYAYTKPCMYTIPIFASWYMYAKIGIVYMQGLVYAYICSRSSIFLEFFKCFIK
jgi:hypothetical protein